MKVSNLKSIIAKYKANSASLRQACAIIASAAYVAVVNHMPFIDHGLSTLRSSNGGTIR